MHLHTAAGHLGKTSPLWIAPLVAETPSQRRVTLESCCKDCAADEPTQWTSSTIERKRLHIPHTTYLHYVQETYDVISLFFLIQPAKMIQQSFSGRHHSPKMQNFVYVQWSGATPPLWKRARRLFCTCSAVPWLCYKIVRHCKTTLRLSTSLLCEL